MMGSLRLYSDARLPCPQRVLVTAAEKGIDLDVIHVDIFAGENKAREQNSNSEETDNINLTQIPEFLERQPFGAIPVLVETSNDTEFVLYESRAISRYLAALSKEGPELVPDPTDLQAVARFEQAASIEVTGFDPLANRLVFERSFKASVTLLAESCSEC
jgi:glutathione S-transferase